VASTVTRRSPSVKNRPATWIYLWPAGLAALLSVAVYVNALDNPFVYDDRDTVVANPSLVDPSNVRFILVHSPFRPVVNVSYAIDRALWGMRPFGFHLTNVILHATVVLLLYAFVYLAIRDAHERTGPSQYDAFLRPKWGAFTVAALFAVHPLMSEAVGYVSGRSEILCGVFLSGAMLSARAAFLRGGIAWAATAILWLLAMLSKEVGLVFPVVMLAYDWLLLPDSPTRRRRRLRALYLPCLVLLIAAGAFRLSRASGPMTTEAPLLNLWTQSIVVWRYIGLILVPVGQSIMHSVHRVTSLVDARALVALAALAGAVAAAVVMRRRQPLVAFGVLWFVTVIAPSSSVVTLREGMAEHRAYFATAGLIMALVAIVSGTLLRSRVRPGTGVAAIVAVLLAALGALTVVRNQVWRDPAQLWTEATVQAAGMWEPHYALADVLRESGDCESAIREYQAVVKMRPLHRDGYTNLGICLARTGRIEEADSALRRALEIDPSFARGYTNLGALALTQGDHAAARDAYQHAIQVEPENVLARMQLARLYEAVFSDFHSAARMCGEVRALAPSTPGVIQCVERNQRLAAAQDAGK
jgi:predicted TPR repeat methyltransferase